jgi:cadmium resistance transporter, putative
MTDAFLSSLFSFLSTNLDDLFVLMFLFMQARGKRDFISVLFGRYFGTAIIISVAIAGAYGLHIIPEKYIGLLGFVPITLGIKEFICSVRSDKNAAKERLIGYLDSSKNNNLLFSAVTLSVSNGADNIGVYIPLLVDFSKTQILLFLSVFAVMTILWCFVSACLIGIPSIKNKLQRYKNILVPVIFVSLGIYILLKNHCAV